MPARIGSGSVGHAAITACNSGSVRGARTIDFPEKSVSESVSGGDGVS
jgi:hypothetical protein